MEAEFSDALRSFLARKGFDPQMGARPMARLIQTRFARRWPTSCCLKAVNAAAWRSTSTNDKVKLTSKGRREPLRPRQSIVRSENRGVWPH